MLVTSVTRLLPRHALLLALAVLALAGVSAKKSAVESDNAGAVVLTDENFDALVTEDSEWIIEFYAPWCGFCQRFAPEYDRVAAVLKDSASTQCRVGKVDIDKNGGLSGQFFITRLPTLYHIAPGRLVREYPGDRNANAVAAWVTGKDFAPLAPWTGVLSPFGVGGTLVFGISSLGKGAVAILHRAQDLVGIPGLLGIAALLFASFLWALAQMMASTREEAVEPGQTLPDTRKHK